VSPRKLFVIPARGGSKGIPGKNIKPLAGKPLIHYSLEYARQFADDEDICVTTDSSDIEDAVNKLDYKVPFTRSAQLATDDAGTFDVLKHALAFYENEERNYEVIVLLQPTSPFREKFHFEQAWDLFQPGTDMVVSVKEATSNPYYNLFEENHDGCLQVSKGKGNFSKRQDVPTVYEFNGSIYIINAETLKRSNSFADFKRIVKYVMSEEYSIDLDTPGDWWYAEAISSKMLNA
jgi:CMP-N,N'-diacetyllegionaminic acid synthase